MIFIEPVDAIMSTVRLDWTTDEFFADGGTTEFIDRLAGSLGIHASEIKVAAVWEGSVYVEFIITPSDEDTDIEELEATLYEMIESGEIDLGAPILSYGTSDGVTVELIRSDDGTIIDIVDPSDDSDETEEGSGSGSETEIETYTTTETLYQVSEDSDATVGNQEFETLIIIVAAVIVIGIIVLSVIYVLRKKLGEQNKPVVPPLPEISEENGKGYED
jgi:hypothetical protein